MQGRRTATMPYVRYVENHIMRTMLGLEYSIFSGMGGGKISLTPFKSAFTPQSINHLMGYLTGYAIGLQRYEHYWRLMHNV